MAFNILDLVLEYIDKLDLNDYYIHEHNANMIAYNLLIDDAKTIDELNKIVNHYDDYIKEIYKEASPIEVMKKFKNIILDMDITNSEN